MYTSRRHRHPGSIRSNAGLPSLRESNCDAAFTPQSTNRKPTSAPSSRAQRTPQAPQMGRVRRRNSLRPNASAKGSKHLIQRTLDSRDLLERVLVNRTGNESYDGVNVKPSSIQPVTPPIIIFAVNRAGRDVTPPYWLRCNADPRNRRPTACPWDTLPSGSPSFRCEGC